jgi:hypothetical protein
MKLGSANGNLLPYIVFRISYFENCEPKTTICGLSNHVMRYANDDIRPLNATGGSNRG